MVVIYREDRIEYLVDDDCVAYIEWHKPCRVREIWVREDLRRQGLARRLVQDLERKTGLCAEPMPPLSASGRGFWSSVIP